MSQVGRAAEPDAGSDGATGPPVSGPVSATGPDEQIRTGAHTDRPGDHPAPADRSGDRPPHGSPVRPAPAAGAGRLPLPARRGGTLAFVESPVQLLNVLEWAHLRMPREAEAPAAGSRRDGDLTVVVLSPRDAMTRGQLRRMAQLARDEGHAVIWADARGGTAPVQTVGSLLRPLRRAARVLIGDPFSRYVQLLLNLARARSVVVVDDGTATMEFVTQLARGERLTRWHRKGAGGLGATVFAPVARGARRRLTPGRRRVELFSSMPVEQAVTDLGIDITGNAFGWTRARFGPPQLRPGADLVGTSLVETGVVETDRYLQAVTSLARTHGAARYFAHRRESAEKLHRVSSETGLEVVRPDLPLELVARAGPIGRTILSFPSTVVHTLPLALAGTGVRVAVCEVDPSWLTEGASPRARDFLSGVTRTAPDADQLPD